MRILAVTRIANEGVASSAAQRQEALIREWADRNNHEVVAFVADTVSGNTSPFDRTALGPWLNEPDRIGQWDVLCVRDIARLTRRASDFAQLQDWLSAHEKTLTVLEPAIDA